MSDENKVNGTENDEALNEELENLRETFQQEWDKAKDESDHGPVIQGLDYAPDETEDGDEEEEEAAVLAPQEKEKPKKKHSKALIAIPVVILVLLVGILGTYVGLTIKDPTLNSYLSAYANAINAETDEEKLEYYNEALDLAGEKKMFKRDILENIAVLTAKTSGYAEAIAFINENMDEDMQKKATSKEFRDLMQVNETINKVADGAYEAVAAAIAENPDAESLDYQQIAKDLGAREIIYSDVTSALRYIAEGIVSEETAAEEESFEGAVTNYIYAYQIFSSLGADAQDLLETTVLKLYNKGYGYETSLLLDNYFTEEMLSSPKHEAFTEMLNDFKAVSDANINIYALAESCIEESTRTEKEISNQINADISDTAKAMIAGSVSEVMDGIGAWTEKNLTKAASSFASAIATAEALDLDLTDLGVALFNVTLRLGDTQGANSVAESYLAELVEDGGEAYAEFRENYEEFERLYNSQYTVNETFYPYYYAALYAGEEMNSEEIFADLDALLTASDDEYLTAFVNYYKYITLGFTDGDVNEMIGYLETVKEILPQHVFIYSHALEECYRIAGEYDKVLEIANELLSINIADDYSASALALNERIAGNLDKALQLALSGMDLSGEYNYSAKEAAIIYLMQGDFENAYDIANTLQKENLTVDNAELLKVICTLYDGENAGLKTAAEESAAEIDALFSQYGIEYSENALALIEGTKTIEEVFGTAPYYLS